MENSSQKSAGFYLSSILNFVKRLAQLHIGVRQNAPREEFDLEVTVVAGAFPLRRYLVEVHKLFLSVDSQGCQLLPAKAPHEQKVIRGDNQLNDRRKHRSKRTVNIYGKLSAPFVSAGANYREDKTTTVGKKDQPSVDTPIAFAKFVAGGWELYSAKINEEPCYNPPLKGAILSGASSEPEPIGTFRFDQGHNTAQVEFQVRLPRGGLSIWPADSRILGPTKDEREAVETEVELEVKRNFEMLKARLAGMLAENAVQQMVLEELRDKATEELIVSAGLIEAVRLGDESEIEEIIAKEP